MPVSIENGLNQPNGAAQIFAFLQRHALDDRAEHHALRERRAIEPNAKQTPQSASSVWALKRNSNDTPRNTSAISISSTGRYKPDSMIA